MNATPQLTERILSVYRTKQPHRSYDLVLWDREAGFLVPEKEKIAGVKNRLPKGVGLAHGSDGWAVISGREDKDRMHVKYDAVLKAYVFPEQFSALQRERRVELVREHRARKTEGDIVWQQVHRREAVHATD